MLTTNPRSNTVYTSEALDAFPGLEFINARNSGIQYELLMEDSTEQRDIDLLKYASLAVAIHFDFNIFNRNVPIYNNIREHTTINISAREPSQILARIFQYLNSSNVGYNCPKDEGSIWVQMQFIVGLELATNKIDTLTSNAYVTWTPKGEKPFKLGYPMQNLYKRSESYDSKWVEIGKTPLIMHVQQLEEKKLKQTKEDLDTELKKALIKIANSTVSTEQIMEILKKEKGK